MTIKFHKYQGTGNDFIMIDQRATSYITHDNRSLIKNLCDRRFGIGADGLILLENSISTDFSMVYFNADGNEGSMCGNGGRCIVAFAKNLGIFNEETVFEATDGIHLGRVSDDKKISIQMKDVDKIIYLSNDVFELNTGSPHYIKYVDTIPKDVKSAGAAIRYNDHYKIGGINVNFVLEKNKNELFMATYERGVEDETYSCGTGVTAAALSYAHMNHLKGKNQIGVEMKGGELSVSFKAADANRYTDIWLTGPADKVFEGTFESQ